MNTDKIIQRVAKLLAMANDSSSPEEAMIAAKRARHLMDKHQLSMAEIEGASKSQSFGKEAYRRGSRIEKWVSYLAISVANLHDCRATIVRGTGHYSFQGYAADVIVARLTLEYLIAACERQCKASDTKGLRQKTLFRIGFAMAILRRVEEIVKEREKALASNGQSLVLVKKDAIERHFGSLPLAKDKSRKRPLSESEYSAFTDGYRQGKTLGLDEQLENASPPVAALNR